MKLKNMKLKKGDNIIVIAGKDKGKKGKILKIIRDTNRVVVEGVNIFKKHRKARKSNEKGQIVDVAMSLHTSNVALFDSKSGKPTRLGSKMIGEKKVRISKKSGTEV